MVTDKGLAALPLLDGARGSCSGGRPGARGLLGHLRATRSRAQVTAGVGRLPRAQADGIVGLGGGAALDVAKAIALMANHPGDAVRLRGRQAGRAARSTGTIPYWVALPTTAGTGSEVGRSAVDLRRRDAREEDHLLARSCWRAPCSPIPELTLGLPAKVTAATGMDALTHCVEAYLAKGYHPICDGIALEGLRPGRAGPADAAIEAPSDIAGPQRHDDGLDDGRDRLPEGARRHALVRARALHRGRSAPRPRQRRDDRQRAALQPASLRPRSSCAWPRWWGCEDQSGEGFLALAARAEGAHRDTRPASRPAGVDGAELDRLAKLAFQDSCHQNNPRPVQEQDFRRIYSDSLA